MPFIFNPFTNNLDFRPDLSGYVPYTGATADVDLGAFDIKAERAEILDANTNVIIGDVSGDARGFESVDIQSARTLSTQVASGTQTTVIGYANEGSGGTSTVLGYLNKATGARGLAAGYLNEASGSNRAIAVGASNWASNTRSVAFGRDNTVDGTFSNGIGDNNTVSGGSSGAFGSSNVVSGGTSFAYGYNNFVPSENSAAFGLATLVAGDNSIALGKSIASFDDDTIKVGVEDAFFIINQAGFSITNDNPLAAVHATGDLLVTDTASLGSELVSNGGFATDTVWTKGTGWAISSGSANKNAAGTGTLSQAIAITTGKYYYVTFDLANLTVGSISVSVGGSTCGTIKVTGTGAVQSFKAVVKSVSTAGIVFTPSSSTTVFGYLDNVSVKEITGGDILAPLGGVESKTLKVNEGSTITGIFSATATLDFPSISSNSTAALTMTVTGAEVGDSVAVGAPSGLESGLTFCGFVSSANTVTIRVHNASGGALDPASATWRATVINY